MAKRTDFKPTDEQRKYRSDPVTLAKEKEAAAAKEAAAQTRKEPDKK